MLTQKEIEYLIEMAVTAPSGDNCQPWSFAWNGQTLRIEHSIERGRHVFNLSNSASMVSLGCLLEAIDLAASSLGLMTHCHTEGVGADGVGADVSFVRSKRKPDPLCKAVKDRHTNRTSFEGEHPDTSNCIWQLKKLARKFPMARLSFAESDEEFTQFVCDMETVIWSHKESHYDLYRWLRFGEKCDEGLHWKTLGVPYLLTRLLKWAGTFERQQQLNRLGFRAGIRANTKKLIQSSGGLLCFSLKNPNAQSLIEVGRYAMRTWVFLNQKGFGVHPLSSASFLTYYHSQRYLESSCLNGIQEDLSRGAKLFRGLFRLGENQLPVWLFRIGKAAPLSIDKRSRRLKVESQQMTSGAAKAPGIVLSSAVK